MLLPSKGEELEDGFLTKVPTLYEVGAAIRPTAIYVAICSRLTEPSLKRPMPRYASCRGVYLTTKGIKSST